MKSWIEEHCSTEPAELQLISPTTYMERRNIHEVTHPAIEGEPAYTEWVCDSREISIDEYNMLKSIETIDTDAAIDAYTEQLLEEGVL